MENFCRGACWGMVAGIVVGGIIVAKNKKLACKIREGLSTAEDKIEEVKDSIVEKMQENETNCVFEGCKPKEKQNFNKSQN